MVVTALYAALLAPLFIFLSARVIRQRRSARISLGHGDDALLMRRARVHANFAEYVPFAVICMALAESTGTPAPALHTIGIILLIGRYAHAYGTSQTPDNFVFRVGGMAATFAAIAMAAVACLIATLAKIRLF